MSDDPSTEEQRGFVTPSTRRYAELRERPAKRDLLIACALGGLALATRAPLIRWNLGIADEGLLVQTVERLQLGEVLYRDIHHNYAPGLLYFFVPLFDLFGPSVVVTRVVWLACLVATCVLVYSSARFLAPRWLAVWAAVLPIFVTPPAHKMFVPLSIAAGLALCLKLAERTARIRWIGAAIGLLALVRQEVGGYTFFIALATLLIAQTTDRKAKWVSVRRLVEGVAAVWVPLLLAMTSAGAAWEFLAQLIFGGMTENAWLSIPFPALSQVALGPERLKTSLFFLPTAAVLLGLWLLFSPRRYFTGVDRIVLAQWTTMAMLTHSQFLQRSDFAHLSQGLVAPSLIAAAVAGRAVVVARDAKNTVTQRRLVGVATAVVMLWGCSVLGLGIARELWPAYRGATSGVRLAEPRASVYLAPRRAELISEVLARVRALSGPGEPVLFAPYIPMFGFIAGRPNPTRYAQLHALMLEPDREQEVVAALDAAPVRLVVVEDEALDGVEERRFPRYAPAIENLLETKYRIADRVGDFVFYVRTEQSTGSR